MYKQPGRNDKCPCMSGKKYKNCCINQTERDKWLKENLNAQYIDSIYIMNDLVLNSKKLARYFQDKLPLIQKPIIWLCNPNLNANMRSINIEDMYGIIIKKVPVASKDYFDIAHEIGHLVLGEQGYPFSRVIDGDQRKVYLGSILTNTIIDPIINKEVVKYGFSFDEYMNKALEIQIPILQGYPQEFMLHTFDRHFVKCLLIEKILEWDLFKENRINPFEELCKQKYPNIYSETLSTISYIREIGIDTQEKVRNILNKILLDNSMNNIIQII